MPDEVLDTPLAGDGEHGDHQLVHGVGVGGHSLRVLADGIDVVFVGVVIVVVVVVVFVVVVVLNVDVAAQLF